METLTNELDIKSNNCSWEDLPLYLGTNDIEAATLQTKLDASRWHPLKEGSRRVGTESYNVHMFHAIVRLYCFLKLRLANNLVQLGKTQ